MSGKTERSVFPFSLFHLNIYLLPASFSGMENFPTVSIRKAVPEDIRSVMEIEHLSFHPEVIESEKVFEERIQFFSDGFFVAEIEKDGIKTIVGYISSELWTRREEIPYDSFHLNHSVSETHRADGDELYISSVAVRPAARGGRIGKKLLVRLLESVSKEYNLTSAILLVNTDWDNAYALYFQEGFEVVGKLPGFFPALKSEAASGTGLIMRKRLERKRVI